ncbi:MAG TPA: hypothetical protein PLQ13_04155 [Candidatus Krumholzibacteria bacterium]|nr:hypothetical protein [Candidatus Krumholzibacteria bacterium]
MNWNTRTFGMALLLAACTAANAWAGSLGGEVKLGGIVKDETAGDLSVMPETFNIHEGFVVSRVNLHGQMGPKSFFNLDVHEVNHESARGLFSYRVPSLVNLTLRYDQHRQLFDAAGDIESRHKNMRGSLVLTPSRNWKISADFGDQRRTGDRVSYPAGTASFLGAGYDYKLYTGRVEAEGRSGARTAAVGYEFSKFTDEDVVAADRKGQVVSARLFTPCVLFPDLVSHYVRASYGKQELTEVNTDYTMGTFQYLGVIKPARDWQLKYRFFGSRVDDSATGIKTDYIRNDGDVVWTNPIGNLTGGYGYVTNDDDYTLTKYDVWRVGGTFRYEDLVTAKVSYASSEKTDEEQLTLLKDMEANRFKASLQARLTSDLTVGGSYQDRQREFPLIDVKTTGQRWAAFGRLVYPGWGAISVDYSYSDDEYVDRLAGFRADNSTITGRVDLEYVKDLRLSFGATYLDIGKDLDIEKSILSFEGHYDLMKDYFVEVKYNVYNYDDYVLLDRYYTANVVWFNAGYRFSVD